MDTYDTEAEATEAGNGTSALYGRIRERQQELLEARPINLEVPGFSGLLRANYRPLSHAEMARIEKRHAKRANTEERALFSNADFLITASLDLQVLDEQTGQYVSTGLPWGREAARVIWGYDATTAREAMLKVFAPPRDAAIDFHAQDLIEASREPESSVEDEVVGESRLASTEVALS